MTLVTARRFVAPVAAGLAVLYLAVMWAVGAQPVRTHLINFEAKGVMAADPKSVARVRVTSGGRSVVYVRREGQWRDAQTKQPVAEERAKAISLAVKFMRTANPVRVLTEADVGADAAKTFGFATPALSVRLERGGRAVLDADFGNLSSDGFLHYMRVKGDAKVYLMSRFVLAEWQKTLPRDGS